jgi:transcriptional regulator with XRE-family HTH domain
MDQIKIGKFLKELRSEKKLTQEELASKFNVSNRSVSRWENGNNMPDFDILIDLADFYRVDVRDILNGERKNNMNNEMKKTVLQAIDYENTKNEKCNKRVRICNAIAMLFIVTYTLLKDTTFYNDNHLVIVIVDIMQGMGIGMLLVGLIMSSRHGAKIREFKQRLFKKNMI